MQVSQETHDQLFFKAHTAHGFINKPVDEELLKKALELAQLGPTALNTLPMRVVFLRTPESKEKLLDCLMPANLQQTTEAPVTAIVCFDLDYVEKTKDLSPFFDSYSLFKENEEMVEPSMIRNGHLEASYFIMALRSLGLDVGPMSGFSNPKVDELFLKGTRWKSNFLMNIGYSNSAKNFPRFPKLTFEEASMFA